MRSPYVARTPPLQARSLGRRSNGENTPRQWPVTGQPATPASHIRRASLRTPPSPAGHQPRAHTPPSVLHYVVISLDGRKLVSRVRVCCSNATSAPIANPPNSAQLGGSPYHSPKLHPGPCNSMGIWPRTDRHTQTRMTTIHFASSTTRAKCN